jgi:isocitrate dehydrogenase
MANMSQTKSSSSSSPVLTDHLTFAYGDGIGPEIMEATLRIIDAANAGLQFDEIKLGKKVYESGIKMGIEPTAWDVLRKNKVFLKAPITTPQGGGYKSPTVTIRKSLSLFANVRPSRAYVPYVKSNFPEMDLVIIRENEEDLYAGIEHQQTTEVVQCLKLVSRPGAERVIRYAFEYARHNDRKRVSCMSKDNIMKHTDGLFHQVFDQIAKEYPDIQADHYIIDIGAALLADRPHEFDVIVTGNLYGDIISDITSQVAGSVGMGGSANIGTNFAMFEAVHGSAPDIAGKGLANPSGLISAATMMLDHIGKGDAAATIQNALLKTVEDGIHTGDIAQESYTRKRVGTKEFTQAIIDRLGEKPAKLKAAAPHNAGSIKVELPAFVPAEKKLVGVDVFLDWYDQDRNPDYLGEWLDKIGGEKIRIKMITNRGVKVYPNGLPETFCTDHWRCRFVRRHENDAELSTDASYTEIEYTEILGLLQRLTDAGLNFIKIENLYYMNGERAFSLGQGE